MSISCVLLFGNTVFAAETKKYQTLVKTLVRYRAVPLVTMDVQKKIKKELLGTEDQSKGQISISAGHIRLQTTEPDQSLLVFDGKTIWVEQTPSKDFPGPIQVSKSKVSPKNRSQVILCTLLSGEGFFDSFEVVDEKKAEKTWSYKLKPKIKDLNIASLEIKIGLNGKSKEVQELSFVDDVENRTQMSFTNIEFHKKSKTELFKYNPPAGAQVTNL